MKRIALILCLIAAPAAAQEPEEGLSLMERGARLFFEGLMREVEPALKDLEGAVREMEPAVKEFMDRMGPALTDLIGKVDDLANYEAPEMLPNGDIILRRKPDAPLNSDPVPDPETGAVDL